VLGAIIKLIPKIGPLKTLVFRDPTPETEELYFRSINTTVDRYRAFLNEIRGTRDIALRNLDLDTGKPVAPGEGMLADETYRNLVRDIAQKDFKLTSAHLRDDILKFFSGYTPPTKKRSDRKEWQKTLKSLNELRSLVPHSEVAAVGESR
jgi:hypothetical protein